MTGECLPIWNWKYKKWAAANERFGASGAVTRPKVCANLQVFRPSERQWKPRLRQAAGTLEAMRGTAQCHWEAKKDRKKRQEVEI
jgi:hypothetical protein